MQLCDHYGPYPQHPKTDHILNKKGRLASQKKNSLVTGLRKPDMIRSVYSLGGATWIPYAEWIRFIQSIHWGSGRVYIDSE